MKGTYERTNEVPIDPLTGGPCQHVQRRITEARESGVVVWNCRDCGHWAFSKTFRDFDASMPSADFIQQRAKLLRESPHFNRTVADVGPEEAAQQELLP